MLTEEKEKPPVKAMLVQSGELQGILKEPALRILDVRQKEAYDKSHIAGAVWVDVAAWQDLVKSAGGLRNVRAWEEKVSDLGIGADKRVVVYGASLPDAARIWWTLKYLGLESVAILDGGWDVWLKEERPVEYAAPSVVKSQFAPKLDLDRLAELDPLKEAILSGKQKVVDARSKDEFTGKEVRGKRGGHITGATHLEWKELIAENGHFKTPDELRKLFRERGILPEQTAVCY